MNTGQMLMVTMALTILAIITLSVNKMIVNKMTTMLDAETSLVAVSLAQTMIDEVMIKAYDAQTVSGKIYNASNFTAPSSLGPNSYESSLVPLPEPPDTLTPYKSIANYSDVDDYNLYQRKAYSTLLGTFTLVDTVFYVSESNPDVKSGTQTFYKKILVTVRHRNLVKPLQLSDVAVYRRYF